MEKSQDRHRKQKATDRQRQKCCWRKPVPNISRRPCSATEHSAIQRRQRFLLVPYAVGAHASMRQRPAMEMGMWAFFLIGTHAEIEHRALLSKPKRSWKPSLWSITKRSNNSQSVRCTSCLNEKPN